MTAERTSSREGDLQPVRTGQGVTQAGVRELVLLGRREKECRVETVLAPPPRPLTVPPHSAHRRQNFTLLRCYATLMSMHSCPGRVTVPPSRALKDIHPERSCGGPGPAAHRRHSSLRAQRSSLDTATHCTLRPPLTCRRAVRQAASPAAAAPPAGLPPAATSARAARSAGATAPPGAVRPPAQRHRTAPAGPGCAARCPQTGTAAGGPRLRGCQHRRLCQGRQTQVEEGMTHECHAGSADKHASRRASIPMACRS